jgi:hypothetical protein
MTLQKKERSMLQHHRTVTPRIARMLRELEGTDVAQNDAADATNPAIERRANPRNDAFQHGFKADTAGWWPSLRGSRVRSI